jgi:Ca2+-binding EF-hand superfamily protein
MNVSGVSSRYYSYLAKSRSGTTAAGQNTAQSGAPQGMDQMASQLLAQMDTDGNGSISQSELTAALQAMGPPPMMMGGLSSSNVSGTTDASSVNGTSGVDSMASKLFAQADTNGTGSITADQLKAAMEKMHSHHHHHHAAAAAASEASSQTAASSTSQTDGTSRADSMASKLFALADTNGTGSITADQLKAAMEKMGPPPMMGASGASSAGVDISSILSQLAMQGGLSAYQSSMTMPLPSGAQALSVAA